MTPPPSVRRRVHRLRRYYAAVRLPSTVHHRLRLSLPDAARSHPLPRAVRGISRFSRLESIVHVQGLGPRGTGQRLALTRLAVLPSGPTTPSASQRNDFAAQYLAYTNPCQRFANALAGVHA
jgi:hypothetical protein